MMEYARSVGGSKLRKMTFHDRARMLKALALYLTEKKDQFYKVSWATGATKIDSWIDKWIEPVESFCKENGIRYLETAGRDGWTKILKNKGYSKYYTVLVKEIGND